jgi:type IV secretion system protein VirB9
MPSAAIGAAALPKQSAAAPAAPPLLCLESPAAEQAAPRPHPRQGAAQGRVRSAGSAALAPGNRSNIGAVQVYPWAEGSSYRLRTAPERVSDIALEPGEALVSVASGDTARWVIGDTASGSGAARRTHVLVKPSAPGLATNLVIATDRRLYRVEVASSAGRAMAGIAWTYPESELIALRQARAAAAAALPIAAAITVEALDFSYSIGGDKVPWRPVRVFDDGRQVFIQFPANFDGVEAPPLFVLGADGAAELVNYRVSGRYYVVDRLFSKAELRLGGRHQKVVSIAHRGGHAGRRGGRR